MRALTAAVIAAALVAGFIAILPSSSLKQPRPSVAPVTTAPAVPKPVQPAETVRVIQPSPYPQRFRMDDSLQHAPERTPGTELESYRPASPEPNSVPATLGPDVKPSQATTTVGSAEGESIRAAPIAHSPERYDINLASLEELNALRDGGRIGRAIIRGRPYRSTEELVQRRILSRATFARIKDQIEVGPR